MTHIVADDPLVESRLRNLVNLTSENGASFHSCVEIVATSGDFRVNSKLERSNNDPLIYLPDSCLPRIDDFEVSLEGNDLAFRPRSDKVSRLHTELFGMVLELFNLAGKIETHKQTFPWLVFASSGNIIECLHQGRSVSDKYYDYFKAGDFERLAVESFLGSRYINHTYQDGNGMKAALMPIIDCLNHHSFANAYLDASPDPWAKEGLMVRNSKPLENSDECFVRYNKADALSAYMSYGFVDMSTPVLRSVPLTIPLPGAGVIHIHSYTFPKDADRVPAGFEDIRYFFPDVRRTGKQELQVSHLMIPPDGAPRALRRILEFLIGLLSPDLSKKELKRLVRKSEVQVLEDNANYYNKLQRLLDSRWSKAASAESMAGLNQLIRVQRDKLNAYSKRKL